MTTANGVHAYNYKDSAWICGIFALNYHGAAGIASKLWISRSDFGPE
jgi:hypothetical protein